MELKESLKEWKVVLASASPRRKELLEQIGIIPDIRPSAVEEEKNEEEPSKLVENLSYIKAADVASRCEAGTLVIGADTVVAVCPKGEERPVILGKPGNAENCRKHDPPDPGPCTSGVYRCDRYPLSGSRVIRRKHIF